MPKSQTVEQLRGMSKEQLIAEHDATSPNTVVGTKHYLEELARRDAAESNQRMLELTEQMNGMTRQMRDMTRAVLALTVVNVIIVLISLFVS